MGRRRSVTLDRPWALLVATLALAMAACSGPQTTVPDSPSTLPASPVPSSPIPSSPVPSSPGVSPSPAATATGASETLVGAGDIASCESSGDEATAHLLDGIAGTVFTAGDNAYESGTSSEFADCYGPTWGRHLDRILPVVGNHEYRTAGAAGHFAYFGAAAGDPARGWYATDLGAWRIYALNSNCGAIGGCEAGSPQERWLREDLATNPRACALAIWHHPLFSSGKHGSDSKTAALWMALEDAGAEIVVAGHDHDYERFGPQDASGAPDPEGIVEIVVGTGGRSHYAFRTPIANSLVRDNTGFGVIRFDLDASGWVSTFIPVAGASFTDAASGTCH